MSRLAVATRDNALEGALLRSQHAPEIHRRFAKFWSTMTPWSWQLRRKMPRAGCGTGCSHQGLLVSSPENGTKVFVYLHQIADSVRSVCPVESGSGPMGLALPLEIGGKERGPGGGERQVDYRLATLRIPESA
jgi:hypothetical protein